MKSELNYIKKFGKICQIDIFFQIGKNLVFSWNF
jgi:hypothetical protein